VTRNVKAGSHSRPYNDVFGPGGLNSFRSEEARISFFYIGLQTTAADRRMAALVKRLVLQREEDVKILKIHTLETGWCDRDYVMLHAVFQLLVD
jgi:hypothetical protein